MSCDRGRAVQPKDLILRVLNEHRVMAIATNRPDGWPQTTIVSYVNDGFLLYCFVGRNSQKYTNIRRDSRVSIAIGSDAPQPVDVKGLSLAARASVVTDVGEFKYISGLRLKRYPEYAALPADIVSEGVSPRIAPQPNPQHVALLRITPEIISVLDYTKGFGQTHLVTFSERDLDVHLKSERQHWDANINADPSNITPVGASRYGQMTDGLVDPSQPSAAAEGPSQRDYRVRRD